MLTLCAALLAAGCSQKQTAGQLPTHAVRGRVVLGDRPVDGALVVFTPLDRSANPPVCSFARTAKDGTFVLATYKVGDGAPAGPYVISVIKQDEDTGRDLLPWRYATAGASPLKVVVNAGDNDIGTLRLIME